MEQIKDKCPDSIDMIAIGGSFCNGDIYEKSDLDLVIISRDDKAKCLDKCFILDDVAMDVYTHDWTSFEQASEYPHPYVTKLIDLDIIYVHDEAVLKRYKDLQLRLNANMSNDNLVLKNIEEHFDTTEVSSTTKVTVTEENQQDIVNAEALLTKSTTVNFVANTAKFLDSVDASERLMEFIEIAKVLDGSIIQIEGNIASDNDSASGVELSKQRAETVKQFFVLNGISADRIVTVGNGGKNPVAPNDSEANMQLNRRTDVSFKIIEG